MTINQQTRLAVDPELCLKNDIDRAVIVTRPHQLGSRPDFHLLLHPADAIVLALFDGRRSIDEVTTTWAELTGKSAQVSQREVDRLVKRYAEPADEREKVLIEVTDRNNADIIRYHPGNFIIDHTRVNLKESRLRKPHTVYYLPTLFCPQKCIYCYAKTRHAREENPIGLQRLREIFRQLADLDIEAVSLSGGDPLAHENIFQIIASIIEAGMTPDIPTKVGLSFRRIQQLHDLGVKVMQVSLDSATPEVIDRVVGLRGYHEKIFRVMQDLRRVGMKVRTNTVLTPVNLPTIEKLIDYLGQLGNVLKVTLTPYGRSLYCHKDELFVEPDQLEELGELIATKTQLYTHMKISLAGTGSMVPEGTEERRRRWEQRAYCTANRQGFIILPDGRVTVCEELYDHPAFIIGDLKVQSVMEMWNSPEAMALAYPDQAAVPDGPCKTCPTFAECHADRGRCWRDVLKSYGMEKPYYPDPRCPLAAPGRRLG